jgi:polyferredoxin
MLMGFVWAVTLLTYLLPPDVIWGNLLHAELTANQARFIGVGTLVFTLEFTLARHLFCRFGCAVGYFQSVAWMANPKGMVVAFSRDRARDCKTCDMPRGSACDSACPMRLNPRNIKRMMFSCVQCGQCLTACDSSQTAQQRAPTLEWKVGIEAMRETLHQRRQDVEGKR